MILNLRFQPNKIIQKRNYLINLQKIQYISVDCQENLIYQKLHLMF